MGEFEPHPDNLRREAARYRASADLTSNPAKAAEYRWMADVLAAEAQAREPAGGGHRPPAAGLDRGTARYHQDDVGTMSVPAA